MTTKKTTTAAKPAANASANQPYEEWKVDVSKTDGDYVYEQRKKIRTVYITDAMAQRMNVQTRNSGVRYYKV